MELCMTPEICIQIANSRLGVQLSVGVHSPAQNPGFNPKYFKEFGEIVKVCYSGVSLFKLILGNF